MHRPARVYDCAVHRLRTQARASAATEYSPCNGLNAASKAACEGPIHNRAIMQDGYDYVVLTAATSRGQAKTGSLARASKGASCQPML